MGSRPSEAAAGAGRPCGPVVERRGWKMKVSVIIPVKEINDYVMESHEYLRKVDYPDFEVLIFPDRDTGLALPGARIIATGPVGPAEKRDLAIEHATGEILAFLDDDAYPRWDWLARAVRRFADPEVAAVGGPAVTPDSDSRLQKASGAVYESRLASSRYTYRYFPTAAREVDDFPTVNLFVRKDVFARLGGFDTAYWPGEDTKLCLDITRRLGLKIIYDPEVIVYHHRRKLFGPHLRQVSRYAFQRGLFVRTFPETSLRPGYFVPSAFLLFAALGLPASIVSGPAAVAYLSVLTVYSAAVVTASLASALSYGSLAVGALTLPGIMLTHAFYGYHFIRGLLSGRRAPAGVRVEGTAN